MALAQDREHVAGGMRLGEGEDDASLVRRAQEGDSTAMAVLYRRYVGRVYAYAFQRLHDRDSAEDAAQETFLRAVAALGRCRNGGAFGGWLFAIAANVVTDAQRRAARGPAPLAPGYEATDPEPSPEDWALRGEQRATLAAARARCLNDRDRKLFDLLLAGLGDREIAGVLGKRHGAVRTAHWRLLAKLRACWPFGGAGREGDRVAT